MKFNAIRLTVFSFFFLAVFSNELPAQTTTSGALIGVVTDSSNAVVPDAEGQNRLDSATRLVTVPHAPPMMKRKYLQHS